MDEKPTKPTIVPLVNIPAAGTAMMDNLWGGNKPLHVFKADREGVYITPWRLTADAVRLVRDQKGRVAVAVVLDLNHPGHPAMSLSLQAVQVLPDDEFAQRDRERRQAGQQQGGPRILAPAPKKLIIPGR